MTQHSGTISISSEILPCNSQNIVFATGIISHTVVSRMIVSHTGALPAWKYEEGVTGALFAWK